MSAYIVDRETIAYLVEAARHYGVYLTPPGEENRTDARHCSPDVIGQMLWDENIRSVSARYPDDPFDLPGPIGGAPYDYGRHDLVWGTLDPIQVLATCDCYEYQSCEHKEWPTSEAYWIIKQIRSTAIHALPGYNDAVWGAPEPLGTVYQRKA